METVPDTKYVKTIMWGKARIRAVLFNECPTREQILQCMIDYFGEVNEPCYYSDNLAITKLAAFRENIQIPGRPRSINLDERWIEIALDDDTYCGERNDPYVLQVGTASGQDAFTVAIADGFAKFVAGRHCGTIVEFVGS